VTTTETETITEAELADALKELAVRTGNGNSYFPELARDIFEYVTAHREPGPSPEPAGVYCRVQIKGYQEYTGYLTEGTFFGVPYGFLRDAEGREIAKFPPDSVHLILSLDLDDEVRERPALTAADFEIHGEDDGSPF
jgi:hypothetical protein